MILPSHYYTNPLPTGNGYTWTLASRLGAMLKEIENLYGSRDKSWTFVGIEFEKDGPQNWFPGNCKNVAIQLNINALNNNSIACYQLAHEAVHLLAPDGKIGAPAIEEGLATMYSEDFVAREFGVNNLTSMLSYKKAAKDVRELLAFQPNVIKSLRNIEPSFKNMDKDTFKKSGVNYPNNQVEDLLARFVRESVLTS